MPLCSNSKTLWHISSVSFSIFASVHNLRLLRLLFDGQEISISLPFVFEAIHEFAHELDSEAAYGPFLQGFCGVRFRRLKRVEGLTVVFHFRPDLSRLHAEAHPNFVFAVVRVTIRDDVGE